MKDWLKTLKNLVDKKPIVVLQFEEDDWRSLMNSRRGPHEFTIARSHETFDGIKTPTACLVSGQSYDEHVLYFGLIGSSSAVTTLDTRIKVKRCVQVEPFSLSELGELITDKRLNGLFNDRIGSEAECTMLTPKVSVEVITQLAVIDRNRGGMRAVAESLSAPKYYRGPAAMQEDAVHSALSAFGLSDADQAVSVELFEGKETALARVPIMEDSVIEHDARYVPGYDLIQSDVTGRAVFQKREERLEVYTANRCPLENVLGVDLIYVNETRHNIVMLQYKMLNPSGSGAKTDWIYRPDEKLDDEISRMKKFARDSEPGEGEYRLNPDVFYLKFVKRNAALGSGGIILPLEHFELLRDDPASKGPRGGLRVSYKTLDGSYMRGMAFLDLIRSGYIGSHAEITAHLKTLIKEIIDGNRAVIAAIQTPTGEAVPVFDESEFGDPDDKDREDNDEFRRLDS
ncbi:MAG TPA: hypothetical protein PKK10_08280 [Woeseiaceae bacterium]|nr:hypothetical protein [Woeseiaceae bacterium]